MENLSMFVEFIALSQMVLPSPWSGCLLPAVQFRQPQAIISPSSFLRKQESRLF